ncbi:hypothetical protein [Mesorhizobium sp. 131-2-1]|uniref:hypothetical protein n=1 Tax=Mesorhizobium sp. 131-2-1 TaxID=2744518 RepID=UPI0019281357|nr:hypothetical protein [Mesorhizobium sp. 131-2-1]
MSLLTSRRSSAICFFIAASEALDELLLRGALLRVAARLRAGLLWLLALPLLIWAELLFGLLSFSAMVFSFRCTPTIPTGHGSLSGVARNKIARKMFLAR